MSNVFINHIRQVHEIEHFQVLVNSQNQNQKKV